MQQQQQTGSCATSFRRICFKFRTSKKCVLTFWQKIQWQEVESSKTGEVSTKDSAAMKDPYTNRFTSKDQRISKNMSNVDLFGVLIFHRKSLDFC